MRYKSLFLLVVFVGQSMLISAQQVDSNAARNIAESFISAKKGISQKSNSVESQRHTVYGDAKIPLLYIFNFEGGGFVIVAADKNAEPILAYSATGTFSMGGANPAAESWIDGYAQGIAYAVETKAMPTPEMLNQWNEAEKGYFPSKTQKANIVEPLLTSKWNQDRYYNALCPDEAMPQGMGSYDNHVPNGCVALAMAQIMYYHRYPRKGGGNASSYVSSVYGQQRADYRNANYDYEAMSDVATGYSNAIAQLCYHAGVSVKMDYGANGSGAYTKDAVTAFPARFIYKSTLGMHTRGTDNLSWKNLLKTDLNRGLPVYYAACGSKGRDACHAFVCDGYDDKDYFHFNWGWGGNADGYYSIDTMLGYTRDSEIITGIEPHAETTISTGSDTLTATYGSFSDGSPPRKDYANNTNRSWLIAPQNGKNINRITLVTSYFSTEENNDIVRIYSGNKADPDSMIAELSGVANATIEILSSQCFVTFTSNGSITGKGFKFTYTSTKTSANLCPAQIPSSTDFYEESQGKITNNDGDGLYDSENTCYWAIKPQDRQAVGLRFAKFDLEAGDFVELYTWDGTTDLSSLKYRTHGKYRFTKENPPELNREYLIVSVGAFVRFRTDNNLNASGFELNWYAANAVGEAQLGMASLHIFPNPANDILKIQIETLLPESVQLVMTDILGRTVYTSESTQPEQHHHKEIDITALSKGIYSLTISTQKGRVTRKVVVR